MDFFNFFYRVFRAPEAFRRLPGARGVIFPKYEPVASHGDPFQAGFSKKTIPSFEYILRNVKLKLDFLCFWRVLRGG